ncbi:hypothetical protein BDN71DRAFT_1353349, partial [Pleurotus eryngii]
MRQKLQTKEDAKFRSALENMRYRSCTLEDVQFLRGRVSANIEGRASVCDAKFRNVSIITARHVNKDAINVLGEQRFAAEHKMSLTTFCCEDTIVPIADLEEVKGKKRAAKVRLDEKIQRVLWEQPACSVEKKIPAKLNLCKGLPVMLRDNSATELCMTNGQEGTVFDWVSATGVYGQLVLDVLFVELKSPPKDVQFEGLPLNVVPILRTSVLTWCDLPSGKRLHVSRSQVEVTVNYAMTDFASQGKTRENNVVHLNDTTSHQGYYTALSRSATAAGTLILQGFNPSVISDKKCSGALCQEFCDLELLDDITRLHFEGKLPASVIGDTRRTLIHAFRQHKSDSYVPQHVHSAICWNKKQPYIEPDFQDLDWSIIPTQHVTKFLPMQKQVNSLKHIIPEDSLLNTSLSDAKVKCVKFSTSTSLDAHPAIHHLIPIGCQWSDNSYAYDTVISLLYHVWLDKPSSVTTFMEMSSSLFPVLLKCFEQVNHSQHWLTDTCEYVRQALSVQRPSEFWYGEYVSVSSILDVLFSAKDGLVALSHKCADGHCSSVTSASHASFLTSLESTAYTSTAEWCSSQGLSTRWLCIVCSQGVMVKHVYTYPPYFIAFDFAAGTVNVDREISLDIQGLSIVYYLKCVVYYGRSHFIGRYLDKSGKIWIYDGMS